MLLVKHINLNVECSPSKAWEEKLFFDVTLACGNRTIGAHKLVLCACSPFFESVLLNQPHGTQQPAPTSMHPHPMLFFNEIHYDELYALVEFMYRGFLTVTHHNIPAIIRAAHILQIRGLSRGFYIHCWNYFNDFIYSEFWDFFSVYFVQISETFFPWVSFEMILKR